MNKALLVATALVGLLFTATSAFAVIVSCDPDCYTGDTTLGGPTGPTIVGNAGTGTLTINGPYTTESLTAGYQPTGNGTVIITTTGTLNDDAIIGDAGTGVMNNSGTQNVTGNLILGNQSTGNGTYNLNNGGTLTVSNNMLVGNGGVGVFNQVAGPVTSGTPQVSGGAAGVEGDVVIGAQSGSQGTYNLGDATAQSPNLTVNGSIIIGRDPGSNGATVPGATPTNPNLVIQGDGTNLSVFYNGGASNANPLSSDIMVGLNGNGAVTQRDNSTVYMDGDLSVGINQGAVGSYNLNATSNGGNVQVGNFLNIGGVGEFVNGVSEQTTATGGTGYFTQTSGDVTVVQDVNIGNNGGTGTYTMSGGTLSGGGGVGTPVSLIDIGTNGGTGYFYLTNGTVNDDMIVGDTGTGTFTNSGGN